MTNQNFSAAGLRESGCITSNPNDRPERWSGWYFKESRDAFIVSRKAIILTGLFHALEPLWRGGMVL